ncbi:MAG: hypothetical protein JWQ71_3350 [Pedosphaera sp.]|nr:hypothetical protein [Pedosphaera sp.]
MVRDTHLAEDVTQGVFVALAQNARQLIGHPVLAGWLHRTTQNLAANTVRSEVRRRAREQESVVMNELLATESDALWERVAPQLDNALGDLSEADRDALLLRYFQRKSAHEIAETLGVSDEAAQKRVNRAVERLRELFSKRGVTVGASGLAIAISTNAVQAAPVGLAVNLAGTVLASSVVAGGGLPVTLLKIMAMTKFKTGVISAMLVASVAMPLIIERQAQARLRDQKEAWQQRADQLTKLQADNERLSNRLAAANSLHSLPGVQSAELLRLRSEITRLQKDKEALAQSTNAPASRNEMLAAMANLYSAHASRLKELLETNPSEKIPELKYLTGADWLDIVKYAVLDNKDGYLHAMSSARARATINFGDVLEDALRNYAKNHGGQFPTDIFQLNPWFKSPVEDEILRHWEILPTSRLASELRVDGDWVIIRKDPVNAALDQNIIVGLGTQRIGRGKNQWVHGP